MSGTSARGLDANKKTPFVTIVIMFTVIFLAAACSPVTETVVPVESARALQATSGLGDAPDQSAGHQSSAPESTIALEQTVADMLGFPGSTVYSAGAVGWTVPADTSIAVVYRNRGYRPLWVSGDGHFTPRGAMLLGRLAHARVDALDPAAYHIETIRDALAQGDAIGLSAAELMLSEALMQYSADLWDRKDKDISLLARAAAAKNFGVFLNDLAPADRAYVRLRNALAKYNTIVLVGGWDTIPADKALRLGLSDNRIPALRRRLALTGDLRDDADTERTYFDGDLEKAVKRHQRRHGLVADGAVGAESLAALNIPAEIRVAQVAANLRLQRKPESRIGDRAIVVNIAAYDLVLIDGGREVMRTRTIVGQPGRETPRMISELKWLEINPTWSVPRRIAVEEIMPRLRIDGTEYLSKRGIRLYDRKWRELDAESFDMAALNGDYLPFILRQDPGPANPLGNVKFMFPNNQAIYLHDTPSRRLFNRSSRALSHGCVRVSGAAQLAMLLLEEEGWTRDRYNKIVAAGKTYRVRLHNPMPIHIVTRTVWVEADNSVHFRADPYENGGNLQLVRIN
jgi:murein L,D-transpeptidase YcbB/YkuD